MTLKEPQDIREQKFEEIRQLREKSHAGGGEARVQRQRDRGRNTARARLDIFLAHGSFREVDAFVTQPPSDGGGASAADFPGDSVISGWGTVDGQLVYVYSQDFTVFGGSLSKTHAA